MGKNPSANKNTQAKTIEWWQQSRSQLSDVIEKNKPFYQDEIWMELRAFSEFAFMLAVEYQQPVTTKEQVTKRSGMAMQAKNQYGKVELAIRKRLNQFDSAN
jgi:hypothetical protein